jgi:hypothetical protein
VFDQLSALAWGLVAFAVIIGVGTLVLVKLSNSLGLVDVNNDSTKGANLTTDYLKGQLGTSGLAGWAPALIAVSIGALILGLFIGNKGRKY